MGYRVLAADDATWQPSRMLGVLNCDLAGQLGTAQVLQARLWRLEPGEFNPLHRHRSQTEVYVLLEGRGRIRVGEEAVTLAPLSAVAVDPPTVRQIFNDTDGHQLWLIFGAPAEPWPTAEDAAYMYPGT